MRISVVVGTLISAISIGFAAFYVMWFFGFLPIDPDLAVKIPVFLIVLALCFIAAWLGYVMATAPSRPKPEPQPEAGNR